MTTLKTRLKRFASRCESVLKRHPGSFRLAKAKSDTASPDTASPREPVPAPSIGVFTQEMLSCHRMAAERMGVEPDVHPEDFIYWHFSENGRNWGEAVEQPINYYFEDGARSAAKVAALVAEMGYDQNRQVKLLEFAAGYGMVSRHLKKFAQFDLVSCDIHPKAIDFLTKTIGIKTITSAHVPEGFSAPQKYDVVFALSFFTHLPASTWGRWLKTLYNTLNAPGYLLFTTHGQLILEEEKSGVLADNSAWRPSENGFWFRATSEQKDLDTNEYGVTITLPEYVHAEIKRQFGAVEVIHRTSEWWNRQDLWIVKRHI